MNLAKYSSMLAKSNLRDDLDDVTQFHRPERAHIIIQMPSQDKSIFSTKIVTKNSFGQALQVAPQYTYLMPFIIYNKKHEMNKINTTFLIGSTSLTHLNCI